MSFYFIARRAWLCATLASFCVCCLPFSTYGIGGEEYCVSAALYCVLCGKDHSHHTHGISTSTRIRVGSTDSYGAIICDVCSSVIAPLTAKADATLAPDNNLETFAASLSSLSDTGAVAGTAAEVLAETHTDLPHTETAIVLSRENRLKLLTQVVTTYMTDEMHLLENIMSRGHSTYKSEDQEALTSGLYDFAKTSFRKPGHDRNGQLSMLCNLLISRHPKIVSSLETPFPPRSPFPFPMAAISEINNFLVQSLLTRYYLCSGVWWMVDINLFICYHTQSLPALDHEYTNFGRGRSLMSPVPSCDLFDFYRNQILYENALGFPAFPDPDSARFFLERCPENWEIVSIKKGGEAEEDAGIYVVGVFPDKMPRETMFKAIISSSEARTPFLRPAPEEGATGYPKILNACGSFRDDAVALSPPRGGMGLLDDKSMWSPLSPAFSGAAAYSPSPARHSPESEDKGYLMCYICHKIVEGEARPTKGKFIICDMCKELYEALHSQIMAKHDIAGDIADFQRRHEGLEAVLDEGEEIRGGEREDVSVGTALLGPGAMEDALDKPLLPASASPPHTPPAVVRPRLDEHTPALARIPMHDLPATCWSAVFGICDRSCEQLYSAAYIPVEPGQRRVPRATVSLEMLSNRLELSAPFDSVRVQLMVVAQLMVLYKQTRGTRPIGTASASQYSTELQIRTILKQQFERYIIKKFQAICTARLDLNLQAIYATGKIPIENASFHGPKGIAMNEGDLYNMYKVKALEEGALGYFASPKREDVERYMASLPRDSFKIMEIVNDSATKTILGYVALPINEHGDPLRFTEADLMPTRTARRI
jgi:hypothetical protein